MNTSSQFDVDGIGGSADPRGRGWFHTTYWPAVQAAGVPGPQREAALNHLITRYQPALKEYLRARFAVDAPTADDLVQGFLVDKVIRRDLIALADQNRGKFRTFLLTAINRYAIDAFRRESARKRIPREKLSSLEEIVDWGQREPAVAPGADEFNNAFVRQVLALAVHRLHDRCAQENLESVWSVFYHRVLTPILDDAAPKPYDILIRELGLASTVEARNRLVTARRILQRELRALVEEYSNDSEEARQELVELRRFLK